MRTSAATDRDGRVERRGNVFTNDVLGEEYLTPDEHGTGVNLVTFLPGGRTYWHRHDVGQILIGRTGNGFVATRDGNVIRIEEGTVVHTPAGEEHWHGAGPDSAMSHLSIGLGGGADWLEEVSDAAYAEAIHGAQSG